MTALALALASCAKSPSTYEIPLGGGMLTSTSDQLWSSNTSNFVPGGRIAVCIDAVEQFEIPQGGIGFMFVDSSDPRYVATVRQLQTLAESEFESIPETTIDLTGWQACADRTRGSAVGQIRVILDLSGNETGAFRSCKVGMTACDFDLGYRAEYEGTIWLMANASMGGFQRTVFLHELGHALKFPHEFLREDSTTIHEVEAGCVLRTPQPTSQGITVYDPDSIMSGTYCFTRPSLSRLDRLGLSIVYSNTFSELPLYEVGFALGDGSVVAYPGTKVRQKWIAEGAGPQAFKQRPQWTVDSGSPVRFSSDEVSVLSGTSRVGGVYSDIQARLHTIQTTRTLGDEGLYSAVAMTFI